MYRNLKANGAIDFRDGGVADNFTYRASSQQTADMAAHIDFADLGRQHGDDKDFPRASSGHAGSLAISLPGLMTLARRTSWLRSRAKCSMHLRENQALS